MGGQGAGGLQGFKERKKVPKHTLPSTDGSRFSLSLQ